MVHEPLSHLFRFDSFFLGAVACERLSQHCQQIQDGGDTQRGSHNCDERIPSQNESLELELIAIYVSEVPSTRLEKAIN